MKRYKIINYENNKTYIHAALPTRHKNEIHLLCGVSDQVMETKNRITCPDCIRIIQEYVDYYNLEYSTMNPEQSMKNDIIMSLEIDARPPPISLDLFKPHT